MAKLTIFLDFDGVVNRWGPGYNIQLIKLDDFGPCCHFNLEPLFNLQTCLQTISSMIDVEIVISSTWRKVYTYQEFVAMSKQLEPLQDIVKLIPEDRWRTPSSGRGFRGDEVRHYVNQHNITNYVCIDDDSDFYNYQNLIKVKGSIGFSEQNAREIVEKVTLILNK